MMDGRNNGTLRFVVVAGDDVTRASLKRQLTALGLRFAGETDNRKSGLRMIRGLQPDLALLDITGDSSGALEAVRKISDELPTTGIVLLSADASPDLILGGIRAGAHEFLTMPVDPTELDQAVERCRKRLSQIVVATKRRGRIIAVYPTKGGVGGSSVATNLALSLSSRPDTKVCLVDFNLQIGDLAVMLDLDVGHSFARSIEDGKIDESKLESLMLRHRSGLRMLTMCDRPEESDFVLRNHVPELFGLLNTLFDWSIVDLSRHIDERTIELLDLADDIVLVSQLTVPTIRNTRRYLDLLDRLEIPRERIKLIVNRHANDGPISVSDLEKAVGMEVFWRLPNEYRSMRAAIDSGNPVLLDSPRSRLSKSYHDIGAALSDLDDARGISEPLQSAAGGR